MKITMYELLGLVKDGKAPKKIKYDDDIWEFDKVFNQYQTKKDGGNIWNDYNFNILNVEVEIIEEEKKMPEKIEETEIEVSMAIGEQICANKINEIIDYLKSKGDE